MSTPDPPQNGLLITTPDRNIEGFKTTFKCKDGYFPSHLVTSTCTAKGKWDQDTQEHVCTKLTGKKYYYCSCSPISKQ